MTAAPRVRVVLPPHLKVLTGVRGEVELDLDGEADGVALTLERVLEALEAAHPVLRGTVRAHGGGKRRPLLRFFACGQDLSHLDPGGPLPEDVARGEEPLLVVGAIAGG